MTRPRRRVLERDVAVASSTRRIARGADVEPAVREHRVGAGEFERRHRARAQRQRWHVGQVVQLTCVREPQHRPGADALLQGHGRAVVGVDQRLAQRQRSLRSRPRCEVLHSSSPSVADTLSSARRASTPATSPRERGGEHDRLEGRPGLPAAPHGPVERRRPEVAAADQGHHVARARVEGHERRLQVRACPFADRPLATARSAAFCSSRSKVVRTCQSGGMIAAELVAELLAQELLGVAGARVDHEFVRADARPHARSPLLLVRRDVAPPRACAGARRGCARAPRRSSTTARAPTGARISPAISAASARVTSLGGLAEQPPRQRLDAVHAGAEVDPIQVQLEDLRPSQAAASSITASTASLALRAQVRWLDRNSVRASCCVIVLPPCEVVARGRCRPRPGRCRSDPDRGDW